MFNRLRALFHRKGGTAARNEKCCSFCRKSHQEVGPLVEGPNEVYICGQCVELSQSIIEQELRRRAKHEDANLPGSKT